MPSECKDVVCVGARLLVLAHLCPANVVVDAEDVICRCMAVEAPGRGGSYTYRRA